MTSWQKIKYWSEIRLNFFMIAIATVERVSQSIHGFTCKRANWSIIPEWHGHSWKSPGTHLKCKVVQKKGLMQTEHCRVQLQQHSFASSVHGKSEKQTLGEVWTARTWRSKRYRAKEEVMKADFSSLGADTVFHGEADTKGAITVTHMNLGGESITRPRRTFLLQQRQRGHLGL